MKERLEESTGRPSSFRGSQFKPSPVTEKSDMPEREVSSVPGKQEDWVKPPLFKGKQRQANGLLASPLALLQQERETPPQPYHSLIVKRRTARFARLRLEAEKFATPEPVYETRASDTSNGFEAHDTIPMMVLRDIAQRQGQPPPSMQTEVTGAAGNAAIVGLGTVSGYIFKYGNNFLLQRGLGGKGFGLYSISLSLVTLIASVFDLGLDNAMIRYIAIYRGKKQTSLIRTLTIFCTMVAGITGILGSLLVVYIAPWLANLQHKPTITPVLQLMAIFIPLFCLQTIWVGGLQGLKQFKQRVLVQRLIVPFALLVLTAVVLFFFHDVVSATLITFFSLLVGVFINFYFFFRAMSRVVKPGPRSYEVRTWLSFAIPNLLTTVLNSVLDSVDTLLLAFFVPVLAIGQYAAASKFSGFIAMPLNSLSIIFTPTIAELHVKGEKQKLEAMFKVVTNWSVIFSLPIFLITTLFAVPLLALSGKDFIGGAPLLIALAAGSLINVATGPVGYLLLMTGHQKYSLFNSLSAIVLNLVLGLIMTPRYGAMGTAISTGLAVVVINIIRVIEVYHLLKIQPYRKDTWKPIAAGAISAVITGVPLYLLNQAHFSLQIWHLQLGIELQLTLLPVFFASYIALLALFKISPEDKVVLDKLGKKFKFGMKKKK